MRLGGLQTIITGLDLTQWGNDAEPSWSYPCIHVLMLAAPALPQAGRCRRSSTGCRTSWRRLRRSCMRRCSQERQQQQQARHCECAVADWLPRWLHFAAVHRGAAPLTSRPLLPSCGPLTCHWAAPLPNRPTRITRRPRHRKLQLYSAAPLLTALSSLITSYCAPCRTRPPFAFVPRAAVG